MKKHRKAGLRSTKGVAAKASDAVKTTTETTKQAAKKTAAAARSGAEATAARTAGAAKAGLRSTKEAADKTAHAVHDVAQALLATDLADTLNSALASLASGTATVYDKAMDAEYLATHVGGGAVRRSRLCRPVGDRARGPVRLSQEPRACNPNARARQDRRRRSCAPPAPQRAATNSRARRAMTGAGQPRRRWLAGRDGVATRRPAGVTFVGPIAQVVRAADS